MLCHIWKTSILKDFPLLGTEEGGNNVTEDTVIEIRRD
jgi:hypothetical protein